MSRKATKLFKKALSILHHSGAGRLLAPFTSGRGIIFTLHHVRPDPADAFEPNRILKVTPEFLECAIKECLAAGYDIVSLDEAAARMTQTSSRKFACFTFDDGYKDNREYAYPIFKRYNVPFTIYIPTEYPEGRGELWWLVLQEAIRSVSSVRFALGSEDVTYPANTAQEKNEAFHCIYWRLRGMPEKVLRAEVAKIAAAAGYDTSRLCSDLIMTWDEIRDLAKDPLVTFGAHTKNHLALAKLPEAAARAEIEGSIARLEAELGRPCRHFSYPYGDVTSAGEREFEMTRALGLTTAVTTRKGVLSDTFADKMTGLPRVSLNGDYQDANFVRLALTGAPFAILDALRPLRDAVSALRARLSTQSRARERDAANPGVAST